MAFEQFNEDFDRKYSGNIYQFMEDQEYKLRFCGMTLEANLDDVNHDSYGNEDSSLRRIYRCPEHDNIFVEFTGNRSSYNGEEWYDYKQVEPKQKTISVWE